MIMICKWINLIKQLPIFSTIQKPNRPSPRAGSGEAEFRRPALPSAVYAVNGMGLAEATTVEGTMVVALADAISFQLSILERSALSFIDTRGGERFNRNSCNQSQ